MVPLRLLVVALVACATTAPEPVRLRLPSAPGPVRLETIARLGGSGAIPPRRVWEAARAQILGLERCYAERVAARPGLAGAVVTAIALGPEGRVTRGAIREDGIGDEGLLACTRSFFRALRVSPPPVGGMASFELALRFDPSALPEREAPAEEPAVGDFDPAIVARTLRMRLRALQNCYVERLRENPTLQGTVYVVFTIAESGLVTAARTVENTTGDPGTAACVLNIIRRFRFSPGPEGGSVRFEYDFSFAPPSAVRVRSRDS
ncbi:MAG: TonB family protein [Myxococcota bacterium]